VPAGYDDTPAALFDYHHSMLVDDERTKAFFAALMGEVQPGDVVVDIGAGTGVLSVFCAMAGARHVYAIEEGPIADVAARTIADNGYSDRITLIRGRSTAVDVPERGTVLVSETIGNLGLEEGITGWVRDARARLVVPEARIVPRSIDVVAAPVELHFEHGELSKWRSRQYGIDFAALRELAEASVLWAEISPANVLAEPMPLIHIELAGPLPSRTSGTGAFRVRRDGLLHGVGVWFRAELSPGRQLSNEPPLRTPSWSHGFLAIDEPVDVDAGVRIEVTVEVDDDGASWAWNVLVDGRSVARRSTENSLLRTATEGLGDWRADPRTGRDP
jgi:hypothetical protein